MAVIKVALRYASGAIAAAFILSASGCATNNFNMGSYFGAGPPKPKSVVVSEFEVAPGTVSVEHDLALSYRRKLGKVPPDQLKAEVATAMNEAVTEAMVTALADGGLPATTVGADPANGEQTIIVTGRVRKLEDKDRMRRRVSGLSPVRGTITADVQVNQDWGGTRKELLTFAGDVDVAGKPDPAANAPTTTGSSGASEKLTASAAAEARRIGKASASRILAFAAEQGWISR